MDYESLFLLFNVDPELITTSLAILGGILLAILIWSIIWYFVSSIGFMKMYRKAGISGWKAFIPYYRTYVRYKLAWQPKFFWVYLAGMLLVQALPKTEELLPNLFIIASAIVTIIMQVKLELYTAKSYGKGTACGVLLFFFPFIVSLVLGFGESKYVGNKSEA